MQVAEFNIYSQDNVIVEEAYSFLKANFLFRNSGKGYKSLSVLSYNPGEGKTTIAINLSINFARSGMKILLVDTDLRKPIGIKRLGQREYKGLSNILSEDLELKDAVMSTNISGLHYIPCGFKPPNPVELISSSNFSKFIDTAEALYDLVILDTPALSTVTDATIIASKTDSAILVIKSGDVELPKLLRVKEQLEKANANVLGTVLNQVQKQEYKKYFSAYDYFFDESKLMRNIKKGLTDNPKIKRALKLRRVLRLFKGEKESYSRKQ